jgi:hypothetical protein
MLFSYSIAIRTLAIGFVILFAGIVINKWLGLVSSGVILSFVGFAIIIISGLLVLGIWVVKVKETLEK